MPIKDSLLAIGVPRIEAELVDLLHRSPDVSTKEAVGATELRQPEVSVGMRELVERGWVAAEPIPREGKGRPMNRYRLAEDPARLSVHYAALGEQAKAGIEAALGDIAKAFDAT